MLDDLIAAVEAMPKNMGSMRDASTRAKITGPCGDTVEIWLRIDGGKVQKASFMSNGCGYSVACGSAAAKLSEGLTPAEAAELTPEAVLSLVGPVPEDHQHCALLAASTVQSAALDYRKPPPKVSLKQKLKTVFNGPLLGKRSAGQPEAKD